MNDKLGEYKNGVFESLHYRMKLNRLGYEQCILWWKLLMMELHRVMIAKGLTIHDIKKIIKENQKKEKSKMTYERFMGIYTGKIIQDINIEDLTFFEIYLGIGFKIVLESKEKDEEGNPKFIESFSPKCA